MRTPGRRSKSWDGIDRSGRRVCRRVVAGEGIAARYGPIAVGAIPRGLTGCPRFPGRRLGSAERRAWPPADRKRPAGSFPRAGEAMTRAEQTIAKRQQTFSRVRQAMTRAAQAITKGQTGDDQDRAGVSKGRAGVYQGRAGDYLGRAGVSIGRGDDHQRLAVDRNGEGTNSQMFSDNPARRSMARKPNDANTSQENRGSSDRLSGSATP